MTTQKPDSSKTVPVHEPQPAPNAAKEPAPAPRSEALEAELAMLEAILPPDAKGGAR